MDFPVIFQLGPLQLPAHTLFDILSYYLGIFLYFYLRSKQKDHVSSENRQWVIIGAAAGALIGAVGLGALEHITLFLNPPSPLYYFTSKTIVGGLIGGLIGVEICKKIIKEKSSTGDLFVFPLIVSIAIGRIGCFLTGVKDTTVGNPSTLPWAMEQGDGIFRHPTALYEILFLIILGITLFILTRKNHSNPLKNGTLFKLFLGSYCGFRFFIEFIKPVEQIALGLSAIQLACVGLILYYVIDFFIQRKMSVSTKKEKNTNAYKKKKR